MSTIAAWTYNHEISFWQSSIDEFGQPTGYIYQYTLNGSFEIGGALVADADGVQFAPKSIFYLEYAGDNPPERGWKVARSAAAPQPPAEAEIIRSFVLWDIKMFGASEIPDMAVYTQA